MPSVPTGRPRGRPPGPGNPKRIIPSNEVLASVGAPLPREKAPLLPRFDQDGMYIGSKGITGEQEDRLVEGLLAGNTLVNACGLAGLIPTRVKTLLSTGLAAIEDEVEGDPEVDWTRRFAGRLMEAMALAEDKSVQMLTKSGKWEAHLAWLERARKDSWQKKDSLDVNAKVLTGVVGIPLETLDVEAWQKAFAPTIETKGLPAAKEEGGDGDTD